VDHRDLALLAALLNFFAQNVEGLLDMAVVAAATG